jgi:hypothetical protein
VRTIGGLNVLCFRFPILAFWIISANAIALNRAIGTENGKNDAGQVAPVLEPAVPTPFSVRYPMDSVQVDQFIRYAKVA